MLGGLDPFSGGPSRMRSVHEQRPRRALSGERDGDASVRHGYMLDDGMAITAAVIHDITCRSLGVAADGDNDGYGTEPPIDAAMMRMR